MNSLAIIEAELHAYVDGKLPLARCIEIEKYLAQRPEEQERLRAYQAHNRELRALFDPVLEEPLPNRLTADFLTKTMSGQRTEQIPKLANEPTNQSTNQPTPTRNWHRYAQRLERLVAGFAIALVSGSAGWFLHGANGALHSVAIDGNHNNAQYAQNDVPLNRQPAVFVAGLAHQAAVAHVVYSPEITRPVEIGADQEEQLVAWLSKRLGSTIRPPRLGKLGYELIGGRLLPGNQGAVAQFMYHDQTGQRLTLYVSTDQSHNQDTGFRFAQEGPVNVFYWIDGKFGYALSAGINKGKLADVATAVYEQLEKSS